MGDTILEMRNIVKTFPGVRALNDVTFSVRRGEIHALVGENGAGKSTLMNVLGGVYPHGSYEGQLVFDGEECSFRTIHDCEKKGIVIIHQELALIPYLSVGENIFLGNERAKRGMIDWDDTYREAERLLELVGLKESTRTLVKDISVGKQQLVEIAKALSKNVSLLVLDEPTASLNEDDSEHLLKLLLDLKAKGVTSILISHKLNEVVEVADRLTILRDGSTIETLDKESRSIDEDRIIKGMVGRELVDRFPKRTPKIGDVAFEIKGWNVYSPLNPERRIIKDVSLEVRRGEVVGLAGLMGAGRTELAMSVFGRAYGARISGRAFKDGKEIELKQVRDAIDQGISYATEDRKSAGLNLIGDIRENTTIAALKKVARRLVIDRDKEAGVAEDYRTRLKIRSTSIRQKAGNLSGGNQQKVVLSKWIFTAPDVLILDEPTRGIDVGAKYEIYTIINKLADEGKSVIFISSELPEILGVSDRVYVMNEGRMVGEFDRGEATQEGIMKCIMQSARENGNGKH
ncbi:MAG TPA: sugar ABC transporter ATP-binding protein [Spirochaetia bacterium]|nr:ATP-binding cassette domain-containing protein [Spirochaetaceae bacterium]HRW25573.1 sugar ABC transporter ATP-binding protein [Spirochaetia bacterium]